MLLTRIRSPATRLACVMCALGLAGCFPSLQQQYFAATGNARSFGVSAGCSVAGNAWVKLPAGARMAISPPEYPEKLGDFVSVDVSIPAGHTAYFAASKVTFSLTDSISEWDGSVVGSGSEIYDPAAKHLVRSLNTFGPQTEIRGGTLPGSGIHVSSDDSFSYKVESARGFPKEFSLRLPDFTLDGNAVTIPVVHFRYGRALALCGCCGT